MKIVSCTQNRFTSRIVVAAKLAILFLVAVASFSARADDATLGDWSASPYGAATYDAPDANGADLTFDRSRNAFSLSVGLPMASLAPVITVYSGENDASEWVRPMSVLPSEQGLYAPFSEFVPISGNGADFSKALRIVVEPSPVKPVSSGNVKMQLKAATTLQAPLTITLDDVDADNQFNPGDRAFFSCVVSNVGADDTFNTGLQVYVDTAFVIESGTVATTQGTVAVGNTPGDTYIDVDIPYLGVAPCAQSSATITFSAFVRQPFDVPAGTSCTLGIVSSDNAPSVNTDDPSTVALNDSTCVPIVIPGIEGTCANVLFNDNFENGLGNFTLDNVDGATPHPLTSFVTDAWVGANEDTNSENGVAVSTSYYTPTAQADDWLISGPIQLSSQSRVRWWARNVDTNFRDGYEVRISTATNSVADFLANPPIFSIPEEEFDWQVRSVNLSDLGYASQQVYLAWRNNSNDEFLLYLDGIEVCDISPQEPPACPEPSLFFQEPNPVGLGYQIGFTDATNIVRLDNFTAAEPVSRVTWWGINFDGSFSFPCTRDPQTFSVEILENKFGEVGDSLGLQEVTVTPVETGRSVRLGFGQYFYPELEYTVTFDPPIDAPVGWLKIQGQQTGNCYFGWLASPTGANDSLNANPELTLFSPDGQNYAFCVSGVEIVEGEGEGIVEGEGEGVVEGTPEGEGTADGEGVVEGTPEGEGTADGEGVVEGTPEGEGVVDGEGVAEGEGEGAEDGRHSADVNSDNRLNLSEVVRVIQFFNADKLHCAALPGDTEDGYVPGTGDETCANHNADYNPANWRINLSEVLRIIQIYSLGSYNYCPQVSLEDGFCTGP